MRRIIHELVALQEREGWLSPEGLGALAERLQVPLHRLESVSTFYTHFERRPPEGRVVEVCRDVTCRMAGGVVAGAEVRRWAAERGDIVVREVSCLGRCDAAPAAAVGERPVVADRIDALEAAVTAAERGEASALRSPRVWASVDPYAGGAGAAERAGAYRACGRRQSVRPSTCCGPPCPCRRRS